MKRKQFIGKLIGYERLNNSENGNPKYYGVFKNENGDMLRATTATDAGCAYAFLNKLAENKEVTFHETRTGNLIIDYITIVE